jgi:hypothetical protein
MSTNRHETSVDAFFALVRAGLWEEANLNVDLLCKQSEQVRANLDDNIDWEKVYQLAGEQSVVGLVTAGIERLKNANVNLNLDQEVLLQMIGEVQMIEQTNKAMNQFVEKLVVKMRDADIYTLLVKGQGIAQCYERPLWRTSGDVDFFLSNDNYEKAKRFLLPLSSSNKPERQYSKEIGMSIDPWYVELHGTLRTGLSTRIDNVIDSVQRDVFYGGSVRSWANGNTQIFLPAPDCDVFFVFTHFIKHFYKEGGVSIRQLCDWCRLLWTYKDSLNQELLESRIRKAGLMSEWKAFAALAVEYLGMPINAMPLYSSEKKWKQKSEKIAAFILKGGEWRRFKDTLAVGKIFPLNTFRFLPGILLSVNWLKIKERLFGQVSI